MKNIIFADDIASSLLNAVSNAGAHLAMLSIRVNPKAPIVAHKSLLIHASPEKIWNVLSSIEGWNTWLSMVSWSRLNGSLATGTTFDWKASGMKIHSRLHTIQKFKAIGWTGNVMGVKAVHNWVLNATAEGTVVFVEESMEGFLARLFKGFMQKSLQRDMLKSLADLKAAAEAAA